MLMMLNSVFRSFFFGLFIYNIKMDCYKINNYFIFYDLVILGVYYRN